jgi:aminopeptidase N
VVEPGTDEAALEDMARAAEFFRRRLGDAPNPTLRLAESSRERGGFFPGLVNAGWSTFSDTTMIDEDSIFRAHLVAHQWWGVGVEPLTYRDQWLVEGLAGFLPLWRLLAEDGDTRRYDQILARWKGEILSVSGAYASEREGGRGAGAIGLGDWGGGSESLDPFGGFSARKSAWVIHMLRMLLVDLGSIDDQRFARFLGEFYRANAGGTVSTAEFRRAAERAVGEDLGWFFDQWVEGDRLPLYRFASSTERMPDGRYRVTCRIEQSGVPAGFRAYIPVAIEFEGGLVTRSRLLVEGPATEIQLPPSTAAPKRVVFDDPQAVLCRAENVKW